MSFDDDEHTLDEAWGEDPGGDRANDTLRRAADIVHNLCPTCSGRGWTAESDHAPDCDGTEASCFAGCPVQVQVQCADDHHQLADWLRALAVAVPVPDEGRAALSRLHTFDCWDAETHEDCRRIVAAVLGRPAPAVPGEDEARRHRLMCSITPHPPTCTCWCHGPAPAAPGSDTEDREGQP